MDVYMDSLNLHIQELANLASTESAYVSKPLLAYVLRWLDLDDNDKKAEISVLKSVLIDGLDVNFMGTQWETEWLANGKVCNCKACDVARKCLADIEQTEDCKTLYDDGFWSAIDTLIAQSEIVIDRPKETKHPRFEFIYPLDYGYLKDTTSPDGGGIDVWRGSLPITECDAVICTIDLLKKDSEIKILISCTEDEKAVIMRFHNDSEYMKSTMIRRESEDAP